ncbi:MAG: DNA double-strand break repair nuclease NurA [Chloroflexi bacterium]|nr:DNA double-strand break repair nuclease NurA [Chloroflexota bacterium]
MPLDYRAVYEKIQRFASHARDLYAEQDRRGQDALQALQNWDDHGDELKAMVATAAGLYAHWRSAEPTGEPLTLAADPPEDAEARVAKALVLAADGSQIEPDPHAALYYALVNVGLVMMTVDLTPRTHIISELYTPEDLMAHRPQVNLTRDLNERAALAEVAEVLLQNQTVPAGWEDFYADLPPTQILLGLTDGPLELWGAKDDREGTFQDALKTYLHHLHTLARLKVISAGYVDNPHANLVVNTLALAAQGTPVTRQSVLKVVHGEHPFQGVNDTALFAHLLKPGQRSAVFGLASQSRAQYTGDLALHFFYLNTAADEAAPNIARVEIPAWVANDPQAVETLHAVLLWQSRRVPHTPYPYILRRAHEVAVVRREDRQAVETWLKRELLAHGLFPGLPSAKKRSKE